MSNRRFELRVDELDLTGFAPEDARAFAQAFEHELDALLSADDPALLSDAPRQASMAVEVSGMGAAEIGVQSARAIFGRLQ